MAEGGYGLGGVGWPFPSAFTRPDQQHLICTQLLMSSGVVESLPDSPAWCNIGVAIVRRTAVLPNSNSPAAIDPTLA